MVILKSFISFQRIIVKKNFKNLGNFLASRLSKAYEVLKSESSGLVVVGSTVFLFFRTFRN